MSKEPKDITEEVVKDDSKRFEEPKNLDKEDLEAIKRYEQQIRDFIRKNP